MNRVIGCEAGSQGVIAFTGREPDPIIGKPSCIIGGQLYTETTLGQIRGLTTVAG